MDLMALLGLGVMDGGVKGVERVCLTRNQKDTLASLLLAVLRCCKCLQIPVPSVEHNCKNTSTHLQLHLRTLPCLRFASSYSYTSPLLVLLSGAGSVWLG